MRRISRNGFVTTAKSNEFETTRILRSHQLTKLMHIGSASIRTYRFNFTGSMYTNASSADTSAHFIAFGTTTTKTIQMKISWPFAMNGVRFVCMAVPIWTRMFAMSTPNCVAWIFSIRFCSPKTHWPIYEPSTWARTKISNANTVDVCPKIGKHFSTIIANTMGKNYSLLCVLKNQFANFWCVSFQG